MYIMALTQPSDLLFMVSDKKKLSIKAAISIIHKLGAKLGPILMIGTLPDL